ncbi:MAG: hypothetical protein QM831_02885 [Kofleriaceae bacterium]
MKRLLVLLVACHHAPARRVEVALQPGAGASQGHTLLQAHVDDVAITIDLGAVPSPGTYNSGTTALWTGTATRDRGACMLIAGNNSTPTGNFVLELSSVSPPHGSLAMTLYVLPRVTDSGSQAHCGERTTEQLDVRF